MQLIHILNPDLQQIQYTTQYHKEQEEEGSNKSKWSYAAIAVNESKSYSRAVAIWTLPSHQIKWHCLYVTDIMGKEKETVEQLITPNVEISDKI